LQARFDEEANIEWAKDMTDAGIRVIFGIQGIKVHAKLLLVHRTEGQLLRRYAYIGTGNFHEQTAQVYTDFGLMTSAPTICQEVEQVFQYLDQPYRRYEFRELMVSPLNTRDRLVSLIEDEIKAVQDGGKGEILLKLNNLVDEAIIVQLYRASRAGVKIRAIVRGMCALRPGVSGLSEGIQVRSIVDRFLEHPRVYVFHNHGKPKVFISSADIMTRNIDHRVEATCPIHDEEAKQTILDILELQWKDNQKARIIDAEQINRYVKRGNRKKLRSQVEIYNYLQAEHKAK
ncbi:MAG TPA: polyphosphate kinase 1, partial [Pseudidiomarina sp.]|nr:polyphosphate kinase 1 [Pseudidiomarina sp.]